MSAASIAAQTTAFTFQGRLNTSGNPTSGTYEMQFQLFDAVNGGAQIGATVTDPNVAVVNGVFTTTLDFGGTAFDGSARFVEIGVRTAGNPDPFTILTPRQTIKSSPYSIQSKNAATADGLSANCVNCVTSGQIQSIDGSQVTGAIPPASVPSGSNNYIQNAAVFRGEGKDGGQPAASLNIGGNATVGSLDVNGPISLAATVVPGAPVGQGRIYFDSATNKVRVSENGSAWVNLVGATGVSGSGTVNTIPLFSAGTTLGNSLIRQDSGVVRLPNQVTMDPIGTGGQISFAGPNGETGMTIAGASGRADIRYNGVLKIVNATGGTPPAATNGIAIDTAGRVGIGNIGPLAKLDITATGDGTRVLQLTTDRPWFFSQAYTGGGTALRLQPVTGLKNFEITAAGGTNIATFVGDDANTRVGIGTTNPAPGTALHVIGITRSSVVEITGGSDLAEKFEFSEEVKPGMVVAIDAKNAGKLQLARGAYNRRVAGIISGANNLSAGMTLPDVKIGANGMPVALSGRVWVYADANKHAIVPGDMLTTAGTMAGYAKKATSHKRAQGAIIGKAMTELKSGSGLVLVLVTLQ